MWDLTDTELNLDALGSNHDKIKYLAKLIQEQFPELRRVSYPVAGASLKKYGFVPTIFGIENVYDVDEESVYPKLYYVASAYHRTMAAEEEALSPKEQAQQYTNSQSRQKMIRDRRKALADPMKYLTDALIEGKITKDQYKEAQESEDRAVQMVKEVVEGVA